MELPVEISTQLWELETFHLDEIKMIQLLNQAGACDPPWSETIRSLTATLQKGQSLTQMAQVLLVLPQARISRINQRGEWLYHVVSICCTLLRE